MRAWQVVRHGEPAEVLELVDVADPTPGPGQVLVRVRAVAVNFPDVLLARGEYQVRPPLPFSPGIELCGEVVGLGDGVTRVALGDRVVGSRIGVLSELAVLDEREVFPAPAALDDAEAAALTIGYQTAWFGLHRRAALQPGETLLVHAAAGGVGSAAVQLGAAAGARVIGVVGSAAKAEVARKAGADVVIDRSTQDVVAVVKAETGRRGGRRGVRPRRRHRVRAVHQVHRVRGADRRRRLRGRDDPGRQRGARPGEELQRARPALGALRAAQAGAGRRRARRADPARRRRAGPAGGRRGRRVRGRRRRRCSGSPTAPPRAVWWCGSRERHEARRTRRHRQRRRTRAR